MGAVTGPEGRETPLRRICLALPTNRECAGTLTALAREAEYAAAAFGVEVELLVLDSCTPEVSAGHAVVLDKVRGTPGVCVHHLGETAQRDFLRRAAERAGLDGEEPLRLMLPEGVSYGACTNRAFLLAAALGCDSVHRRDSDSRYQTHDGQPVLPIHQELLWLGRRAADTTGGVSAAALEPAHADKPVSLVGASFIGAMSVDIEDIERRSPAAYHDIVSQWAPGDWSFERKRELVAESFRGAGHEPFTGDHTTLALVDPMRVDMCNVAFHRVHEQLPLPPATDTIGSDYFLLHLVRNATLPGVLHNRHIVNYHTPERRTPAGFAAYHLRLVKFFLSMLYLNHQYDRLAELGASLLDEHHRVRAGAVGAMVRDSAGLDRSENVRRLADLDRAYRGLGGRYAAFAASIGGRRGRLLDEAQRDVEDFARLIAAWPALMDAARSLPAHRLLPWPQP